MSLNSLKQKYLYLQFCIEFGIMGLFGYVLGEHAICCPKMQGNQRYLQLAITSTRKTFFFSLLNYTPLLVGTTPFFLVFNCGMKGYIIFRKKWHYLVVLYDKLWQLCGSFNSFDSQDNSNHSSSFQQVIQ